MFIIATLITMIVMLIAFLIIGIACAGASFIVVFGDVLVAIVLIWLLVKYLIKKRGEKK